MIESRISTVLAALGMVAILGFAGVANANPLYHRGGGNALTPEQQTALQKIYSDYDKQVMPLQNQLQAKRAELDALYYNNSGESSKAQTLFREAADIEAKIFALNSQLRSKLEGQGFAGYAGMNGYHNGGGHNRGGGHGGHRGGGHW